METGSPTKAHEAGGLPGLLPSEFEDLAREMNEPAYHGRQIRAWVHDRGVLDPRAMTDLPLDLRSRLFKRFGAGPGTVEETFACRDGSAKLLVRLASGEGVEAVLMPDEEDQRLTVCVSTQIGCPVGCVFCRSGSRGFKRNLAAAEIVGQVLLARSLLTPEQTLGGVVLMGSGEPLLNYDASVRALRILTDPSAIGLSHRKVTLSTVGIPSRLRDLAAIDDIQFSLALSLHASDDATRSRLVPGARGSIAEILDALKAFPLPAGRKVTVEYVMIAGVNDGADHAERLADLLEGLRVKVNLLPLNPHDATDLRPPADEVVARFQATLTGRGVLAFVRKRRGDDQLAACGQLLSW